MKHVPDECRKFVVSSFDPSRTFPAGKGHHIRQLPADMCGASGKPRRPEEVQPPHPATHGREGWVTSGGLRCSGALSRRPWSAALTYPFRLSPVFTFRQIALKPFPRWRRKGSLGRASSAYIWAASGLLTPADVGTQRIPLGVLASMCMLMALSGLQSQHIWMSTANTCHLWIGCPPIAL